MRSLSLVSLLLLATTACGAGESAVEANGESSGANVAPAPSCVEGFEALPDDAGCSPILPLSHACPPGTFAQIGSRECVAVGVTECASGFVKDPSGWGCAAVIAETACPKGSGTRESLGSTTCAPVSDCNAAFPPSNASFFVSQSFTDDQIASGKHFKTIAAAVASAPASSVIAIDEGTYVEKVSLKAKGVSLLGRCSDKVVVKQADGVIGSGIEVGILDGITIKNITFRGFNGAVSVLGGKAKLDSLVIEDGLLAGIIVANTGSVVSLKNVVIRGMKAREDTSQGFGLFVANGAHVDVDDSVFSGNEFVNVGAAKAGTVLTMKRSIVRDGKQLGDGGFGMGVYAAEGANVTIEESVVKDNSSSGVDAFGGSGAGAKTSATLRRSVVAGTKYDKVNKIARGVEGTASTVVLDQTTVAGNEQIEMLFSTGSKATITNTTLRGNVQSGPDDRGALGFANDDTVTTAKSLAIVHARAGMEVQGTSKLTLESALIFSTREAATAYENEHWVGVGISVEKKATLNMIASTIEDAHMGGLLSTGNVTLERTLIRGTRPSLDGFAGRGYSVQNGGVSSIARSAFIDNSECGIIAMMDAAAISLIDSTVKDTGFDGAGEFGIGVALGQAAAVIDGTTISGSKGIGIVCSEAGATVQHTTISSNAVGVHVQDGTALQEVATIAALDPEERPDPRFLTISSDTRFIRNQTKAGSSIIAIPAILTPKTKRSVR